MFCYKCGKEVAQNAQFCEHCGAKLNQSVNQEIDKPKCEYKIQNNEPGSKSKINIWAWAIVLSVLVVYVLVTSFVGAPTSRECIKTINIDGVQVTYRYDYMNFDGETLVQKRYKGTDSAGNVVDTTVTVRFNGRFEGKIDASYIPTEADKYGEGLYYKQVKIDGEINGHKVADASEKLLIGETVYAKYTDMIDEVSGCGLYIKFEDNSNTYTKVVTDRIWLIVAIGIIDVVLICNAIFNTITNKKMQNGEFGKHEVAVQHKVGIGVLFGALAVLITSIIMFIIGMRWRAFLFTFVIACVLGFVGVGMIKDCKAKKIIKNITTILLVLLSPILLIFFILGML